MFYIMLTLRVIIYLKQILLFELQQINIHRSSFCTVNVYHSVRVFNKDRHPANCRRVVQTKSLFQNLFHKKKKIKNRKNKNIGLKSYFGQSNSYELVTNALFGCLLRRPHYIDRFFVTNKEKQKRRPNGNVCEINEAF